MLLVFNAIWTFLRAKGAAGDFFLNDCHHWWFLEVNVYVNKNKHDFEKKDNSKLKNKVNNLGKDYNTMKNDYENRFEKF